MESSSNRLQAWNHADQDNYKGIVQIVSALVIIP
jgi:hypothetical protein